MFTNDAEGTTQVDQLRPVQTERVNRRPASDSPAKDQREVIAPGKMARPALPAGMEESNDASRLGITG
jgi:hypothetical protein